MFSARATDIRRKPELFAETREAAVARCFETFPKAKHVSSSNAYLNENGVWQSNGMDIRFHDRRYDGSWS